ncbi:hypothetical protein ACSVUS_003705 [Vibrio alginolyticus]|uniref:hypothetical protein n=1 Tax=Vibrio diabolicus TaxID=50719 RepID=UPI0024812E2C|nr:hypothetical protein [Vibrio diabolicus]EIU6819595.1 hypothetical protein [Vibrio parahaemolyticus]
MKNYFKSLSAEQPDVRFFGLRLVKFVSVIFGSVFFFTLAVTLLDTSALDWKLNVEGLKFFFLDAMKVPGSILAFYLAVLGLIGANHRSEQTKKQISATGEQNRFSNYFKHLEEFKKHVDGLEHRDQIDMTKIRLLHDNVFPRAYDFGEYSIDRGQLDHIVGLLQAIKMFLYQVKTVGDLNSLPEDFVNLRRLQSEFGMKSVIQLKGIVSHDESVNNRVELFNEVLFDINRFSYLIRDLAAFSYDQVWDLKLSYYAEQIEASRVAIRDRFRKADSLRKAQKDISDMLRDAGVE